GCPSSGSLRRNSQRGLPVNFGKALVQRFSFRISQGGSACTGYGVDCARQRNATCESRTDDTHFDSTVVGKPACVRITISLDQSCTFGNFQGELCRLPGRVADQAKPVVDLLLLLLEAIAVRPNHPQFCQQPEAKVAADRRGIDFHSEMDAAQPASTFGHPDDGPRK